jgi:hypothetical protein
MANMHRVSRWVDYTEHHRPQFRNAAALTASPSMADPQWMENSARRAPVDLPRGFGMHSSAPHSPSSSEEFTYATTPGSPGPMPTSLYQHRFSSPSPSYSHGPLSSWNTLPHDSHLPSPVFSHGYGPPIPPQPFIPYPVIPPGYVIVSPGRSSHRKKMSSRRSSKHTSHSVSSLNFFRIPDG